MANLRDIIISFPQVPALRAVKARQTGEDGWRASRPPLPTLSDVDSKALYKKLDDFGFSMPEQALAAAQ
jgi:hypothetical protein